MTWTLLAIFGIVLVPLRRAGLDANNLIYNASDLRCAKYQTMI
jgi:hypothetical protein